MATIVKDDAYWASKVYCQHAGCTGATNGTSFVNATPHTLRHCFCKDCGTPFIFPDPKAILNLTNSKSKGKGLKNADGEKGKGKGGKDYGKSKGGKGPKGNGKPSPKGATKNGNGLSTNKKGKGAGGKIPAWSTAVNTSLNTLETAAATLDEDAKKALELLKNKVLNAPPSDATKSEELHSKFAKAKNVYKSQRQTLINQEAKLERLYKELTEYKDQVLATRTQVAQSKESMDSLSQELETHIREERTRGSEKPTFDYEGDGGGSEPDIREVSDDGDEGMDWEDDEYEARFQNIEGTLSQILQKLN